MTNKRIDLPSQRARLLMEIEQPLRRKFRTRKNHAWLWWLVVIAVILVSYWEVSKVVDYQAAQHQMVKQAMAAEVDPLCKQYKADMSLTGTAAEETLQAICK